MTWRIKSWEEFQHFRDRTPPWIKLHRGILDDIEWHRLEPAAAKCLVMLWLLASEDKEKNGDLPAIPEIAFRLRMSEQDVIACGDKLSHWLERGDDTVISDRQQDDNVLPHPARSQETEAEAEEETEEETETESLVAKRNHENEFPDWKKLPQGRRGKEYPEPFRAFYEIYPKRPTQTLKSGYTAWLKAVKSGEVPCDLLNAATDYGAFIRQTGHEPKLIETWVNCEGWTAELQGNTGSAISSANEAIMRTYEAMEHGNTAGSDGPGDQALEPDCEAAHGSEGGSEGLRGNGEPVCRDAEGLPGAGVAGSVSPGEGGTRMDDLAGSGPDLQVCQRSPAGNGGAGAATADRVQPGPDGEPGFPEPAAAAAPLGRHHESQQGAGMGVRADGESPRDVTPDGVDLTPPAVCEHRAGRVKG